MPGTRDLVKRKTRKPRAKRQGRVTEAEKMLVATFVADQPAELSPAQVTGLAKTLRRSKELTIQLIETARDRFTGSADEYVDMHKQAVKDALANGDPKSLDVAVKGSQWAIDNISEGGTRIVEKAKTDAGHSGVQIQVGVRVGGMNEGAEQPTVVVGKVIEKSDGV